MPGSSVYTDFSYLYSGPLGPVLKAKRVRDGETVYLRTVSLSETYRAFWPSYLAAAGRCLQFCHKNVAVANAIYLDEQGYRFLAEFPGDSAIIESPLQILCTTNDKPINMYIAWDIIHQITAVLESLHSPSPSSHHVPSFHGHLSPANVTYCLSTRQLMLYDAGFSMIPGPMAPMSAESTVRVHNDRFKRGMPADMYALGNIIEVLLDHVDKTDKNFVEEMVSLKNACQHPCNHALVSFSYILTMSKHYLRCCSSCLTKPIDQLTRSFFFAPKDELPLDVRFQAALRTYDSTTILDLINEASQLQVPLYVHVSRVGVPVHERTSLMVAAEEGDIDSLMAHLDQMGKIHEGDTALMLAAKRDHVECIRSLLGELGIIDGSGFTALMKAADQPGTQSLSESGIIYLLPEARMHAPSGWTAMMFAASEGNTALVAALVSREACMRNRDGRTALMFAAFNGYEQTVKALIGEESNLVDSKKKRAIDYAVEQRKIKCVRVLLSREILARKVVE